MRKSAPIQQTARRPPGRTSPASETATAGRLPTQFSAPKFEMAPSNDLSIRPSSSASQTVAVIPRSRATCTMAGETSVAYTCTPRAEKCAASSPVPQPISRIRSPAWKSLSMSRQTRLRWARPMGVVVHCASYVSAMRSKTLADFMPPPRCMPLPGIAGPVPPHREFRYEAADRRAGRSGVIDGRGS